jgi:hypothetical protein
MKSHSHTHTIKLRAEPSPRRLSPPKSKFLSAKGNRQDSALYMRTWASLLELKLLAAEEETAPALNSASRNSHSTRVVEMQQSAISG